MKNRPLSVMANEDQPARYTILVHRTEGLAMKKVTIIAPRPEPLASMLCSRGKADLVGRLRRRNLNEPALGSYFICSKRCVALETSASPGFGSMLSSFTTPSSTSIA